MFEITHLTLTVLTLLVLIVVLIELRDGRLDHSTPRRRQRRRAGRAYDMLRLTNL
ncbi:MAG: hypothetical protein AAF674_19065 [Pseudomonadota bacterium]